MTTTTTPHPPSAAAAARALTHGLRTLSTPPSHRAVLQHAMQQSDPFRVRITPMPGNNNGRAA